MRARDRSRCSSRLFPRMPLPATFPWSAPQTAPSSSIDPSLVSLTSFGAGRSMMCFTPNSVAIIRSAQFLILIFGRVFGGSFGIDEAGGNAAGEGCCCGSSSQRRRRADLFCMTGGFKDWAKFFLGENCSVCQSAISIDTIAANHAANVYESNICNAEPREALRSFLTIGVFLVLKGKMKALFGGECRSPWTFREFFRDFSSHRNEAHQGRRGGFKRRGGPVPAQLVPADERALGQHCL